MHCFLIAALLIAQEPQNEREWCEWIKANELPSAALEAKLFDETRVDLATLKYSIEVDWSSKWAEGIGQARYYAKIQQKKPVTILLAKDMKVDQKYHYRAIIAAGAEHQVWILDTRKKRLIRNAPVGN